jgi:hypothetical protein
MRAHDIFDEIQRLKYELEQIQKVCEHKDQTSGYWSDRPGRMDWCHICKECGKNLGMVDEDPQILTFTNLSEDT